MTKELKYKSLSIGFDSGLIGLGAALLINRDSKVFAITLLGFFLLITLPKLGGFKVINVKMSDYRTLKAPHNGNTNLYFIKPHETFTPKALYIRNRTTGKVEQVHRFTLIDKIGFEGALVFREKNEIPTFYRTDEFYYVSNTDTVRGYINHKEAEFIVLSIVD